MQNREDLRHRQLGTCFASHWTVWAKSSSHPSIIMQQQLLLYYRQIVISDTMVLYSTKNRLIGEGTGISPCPSPPQPSLFQRGLLPWPLLEALNKTHSFGVCVDMSGDSCPKGNITGHVTNIIEENSNPNPPRGQMAPYPDLKDSKAKIHVLLNFCP